MYLPCRTKPKYRVVGRRKMFWCWPNVFQGRGEWEHEYYLMFINILSKIQSNLPLIKFLGLIPSTFLVGGWPTPLKNMSSSVGVTIPNIWKVIKFMFQTTNQKSFTMSELWKFFTQPAFGSTTLGLFGRLRRCLRPLLGIWNHAWKFKMLIQDDACVYI